MGQIILHQQSFSYEDIRTKGKTLLGEQETPHHFSLDLAQQWLNNQQTFTFHTSGSTGIPKEIVLTRAQLEASAMGTIEALNLTAEEHILVCMNTRFIGGAMLLIRGLILGATLTLQEASSNPFAQIAHHHPYTLASFTPIQLFPLFQNTAEEKEKLSGFYHILVGGAPIDNPLEELLAALPVRIYHTYGMTETVSHIALRQIGKEAYYRTLAGVHIKTDERNCLAIQSASTLLEWVQTNDGVRLIDETTFELLGRVDDVINSGGIKIWPAKIEAAIRSIVNTEISQVLVSGVPDIKLGQQLIVVLETNLDRTPLEENIKTQLHNKLDKYEIPKQIYVLPQFVYTESGKINKSKTLKMINLQ